MTDIERREPVLSGTVELAGRADGHARLLRAIDGRMDSAFAEEIGALRSVIELHKPKQPYRDPDYLECEGDQANGYDWESPDWPCETVLVVARALGVSLAPCPDCPDVPLYDSYELHRHRQEAHESAPWQEQVIGQILGVDEDAQGLRPRVAPPRRPVVDTDQGLRVRMTLDPSLVLAEPTSTGPAVGDTLEVFGVRFTVIGVDAAGMLAVEPVYPDAFPDAPPLD